MSRTLACRLAALALVATALGGPIGPVAPIGAQPPGTALTLHARFTEGGELPSGSFDLELELFSEATPAGSLGTVCLDDVAVENGLFTVEVDFGRDVFTGERRWLGVRARRDTGEVCAADLGSYVPMVEALEIPAKPRSLYAARAASLVTDAVDDADVDPANELNLALVLDGSTLRVEDGPRGGPVSSLEADLSPISRTDRHSLDARDGTPEDALFVNADGEAGIGTTDALATLDVRGDLSLNDHDLRLRGGADVENGLGWYGVGKPFGLAIPDGPVLYGRSGGGLAVTRGDLIPGFPQPLPPPREIVSWRETVLGAGAVGVNRTAPAATLDVGGSREAALRVDGLADATHLQVLGNGGVGIGLESGNPDSVTGLSVRSRHPESFTFPFQVRTKNGDLAFGVTEGDGTQARQGMEVGGTLTVAESTPPPPPPAPPSLRQMVVGATFHPTAKLYAQKTVEGPESESSSYVAHFRNTSTGCCPDVLLLEVDFEDASYVPNLEETNFITFFANNQVRGAIELADDDDGFDIVPGVDYMTWGSDFAEMLPMLDPGEELSPGDVVGVFGGRISRRTEGASWVMALSTSPAFVGNRSADPAVEANRRTVAFVGQVHVRVLGPVREGDYVVASGREDGTAIAVSPLAIRPEDRTRIVGRAWESSEERGEHHVRTIVGLPESASTVGALLAELDAVREERVRRLATLRERIDRIEAALDSGLDSKLGSHPER